MTHGMTSTMKALTIGVGILLSSTAWCSDLTNKAKGAAGAIGAGLLKTGGASEDTGQTSLGLKEALAIGVKTAVSRTGTPDGFFKNEAIRIPLPGALEKADAILRKMGGGGISDMLVEKMNRAAEAAAPKAQDIFLSAVENMTFEDAAKILGGEQNAATTYLKNKTGDSLITAFLPIVKTTMEDVGAVKVYNDYAGQLAGNPLAKMAGLDTDINQYVTEKAVDGLFSVIADQEAQIRANPAARTTDLLKAVFGK